MTALTASKQRTRVSDSILFTRPVAASQTLYLGALVVIDPDTGYAKEATGSLQGHLRCVGIAVGRLTAVTVDPVTANDVTTVSAADYDVQIEKGLFLFTNDSSNNALASANWGQLCYAKDDTTVSLNSNNSNYPVAGIFRGLTPGGECIVEVGTTNEIFAPGVEVRQYPANADLSALQYYPVKLVADTGNIEVAQNTAATAAPAGILLNTPTSGQIALVAVAGDVPAIVGTGDMTCGDLLKATTDGVTTLTLAGAALTGGSATTLGTANGAIEDQNDAVGTGTGDADATDVDARLVSIGNNAMEFYTQINNLVADNSYVVGQALETGVATNTKMIRLNQGIR